jgi:hypothetical protein
MHILYLDESGDFGQLHRANPAHVQPIFALGGILVPQQNNLQLNFEFMRLKQKLVKTPEVPGQTFEILKKEIKGSELRRELRQKQNHARFQLQFLDELLALLGRFDCSIMASVYVKNPDKQMDSRAVYTTAVQKQSAMFQTFLARSDSFGLVIADARHKNLNSIVSHSVLTQRFSRFVNKDRLIESPVFGHSQNHIGLQIADILISGLIVPIAIATYCQGLIDESRAYDFDHAIKLRYATRLKKLQLNVKVGNKTHRGIYVNDGFQNLDTMRMFIHDSR